MTKSSEHDAHRPNVKLYLAVFAALMLLTGVTVMISKFHLPRPQAIALGLFVALLKAGLVASIFMHLWGEAKLIRRFLYVVAVFAALFVLPLIDFALTAHNLLDHPAVAKQHPLEEGRK